MAFSYSNTTTYNLENVLRQNILKSDYYNKTCLELTTWEEVVDEIYDTVTHVEPWMSGNARGPSTAFCLLHRLLTLDLSVRQVRELIDHKDSPYIRAVGFLFLRYVADGKTLWQWVSKYLEDGEMFAPSPEAGKVSVGDFVRDLLLEQYYFETIFPRIPKPVMDSIVEELKRLKLPTTAKGNGGTGGADRRGVDDGNKRPASVKASLSVAMGQRAPNRAGAREDRQLLSDKGKGGRAPLPRSPAIDSRTRSRSPLPPRPDAGRDRARDDRDRGRDDRERVHDERPRSSREDERDRARDDRDRQRTDEHSRRGGSSRYDDRERERAGRREDERGADRDRDRSRYDRVDERDRERSRFAREDERGRYRREDDRGADRQRGRDDRDRRRSRSRDRGGEGAGRRRSRSHSRSRSRERSGRDTRDVFRESASRAVAANADDIRSKYL